MIYHLCFCNVYISLIIGLILGSFEFHQIPIKQTLRQSSVVCVELPVKSWSLPGSLVTNDRLTTSQPPCLEQLQKYSKSHFWVGWTMDVMMILDMCSENLCFVSLLKSPLQGRKWCWNHAGQWFLTPYRLGNLVLKVDVRTVGLISYIYIIVPVPTMFWQAAAYVELRSTCGVWAVWFQIYLKPISKCLNVSQSIHIYNQIIQTDPKHFGVTASRHSLTNSSNSHVLISLSLSK